VYDLATRIVQRVTDKGNINSFDWSKTHQLFVAAKNGHLVLLNITGKLFVDLSTQAATSATGFGASGCDIESRPTGEQINLLEHVSWVEWNPDQSYIVFASDIYPGDAFCYTRIWSLANTTHEIHELGTIVRYLARPRPLGDAAFMLEYYHGGGNRIFDIVGTGNGKVLFSVQTWASFPVGSSDGHHLAARVGDGTNVLEVFDVTAKQVIYHNVFTNAVIELNGWSASGRYTSLFETNLAADPKYQQMMILDVAAKQLWKVQELAEWSATTWLPGTNELLAFKRNNNATTAFVVNPADQTVTSIGQAQNVPYLWPAGWSPSGRYLALFATGTAGEQGIWIWDNQVKRFPVPIYHSPASSAQFTFSYQDWSADDQWVLVVQSTQHTTEINQTVTDFALLAVDVSNGDSQTIATGSAGSP
jgi:hypothetical protein